MPSRFAAALADMEDALDGEFGELVRITPMRSSDFGRAADGDRAVREVIAKVHVPDLSSANIPGLDARVAYEEVEIEIQRHLLPAYVIGKNDEFILLERPGAPRLKVNRVERLDEVCAVYICGPVAS
ncbi:hypothetical protein ACO2I3_12350 [Leptospira interrogans]